MSCAGTVTATEAVLERDCCESGVVPAMSHCASRSPSALEPPEPPSHRRVLSHEPAEEDKGAKGRGGAGQLETFLLSLENGVLETGVLSWSDSPRDRPLGVRSRATRRADRLRNHGLSAAASALCRACDSPQLLDPLVAETEVLRESVEGVALRSCTGQLSKKRSKFAERGFRGAGAGFPEKLCDLVAGAKRVEERDREHPDRFGKRALALV